MRKVRGSKKKARSSSNSVGKVSALFNRSKKLWFRISKGIRVLVVVFGTTIFSLLIKECYSYCFEAPPATKADLDEVRKEQITIKELLEKKTIEIEDAQRFKLRYKYPLGFAMFYANQFDPVVYPAGRETEIRGVKISWDRFRIDWEKSKGDWIEFDLPNLMDSRNNQIRNSHIGLFRTHGVGEKEVRDLPMYDFRMFIEVLLSEGDYVIGVVGFMPRH